MAVVWGRVPGAQRAGCGHGGLGPLLLPAQARCGEKLKGWLWGRVLAHESAVSPVFLTVK